jgi:nucleotide-binding universal stress UspA family protein
LIFVIVDQNERYVNLCYMTYYCVNCSGWRLFAIVLNVYSYLLVQAPSFLSKPKIQNSAFLNQVSVMVENDFRTILLAIDGSASCIRARELVSLIGKKFGSKITVVHVISHDFMHPELKAQYQLPPLILHKIDEVYLKSGEKILRTAEEAFKEDGLQVEPLLIRESEDPADTILNLAKERGVDLIAIGNRAETRAERFELGGVAEKIALFSKIPVLIAKKKTKLGKLLVAVDGSEQANKALDYAYMLALRFKSKLTILHVAETKLASLEPDAVKQISENILSDAAARIKGVSVKKQLEYGSPAENIINVARDDDYDLIVLGSRGLSSVKRFLMGSVSEDVSMHSRRSVLVVR